MPPQEMPEGVDGNRKPSARGSGGDEGKKKVYIRKFVPQFEDKFLFRQSKQKELMIFYSYGGKIVEGVLRRVEQFDIHIEVNGRKQKVPKHELVCFFKPKYRDPLLDLIKISPKVIRQSLGPEVKIKNRYKIPDEHLQVGAKAKFTSRTGHVFEGELLERSRYALCVSIEEKAKIFVYRHSICESELLEPAPEPSPATENVQ